MRSLSRGALIVVEGVDRSGKSTHCQKLVESLKTQTKRAELINFPDRSTPTGRVISEYLSNANCKINDHAIHLLFTANRWEKYETMCEKLKEGVTLIVDRYSYSGIVYTSIKRGMDLNWCKQPENGLIKPDLVLLLTVPSSTLGGRSGFGNERYETLTVQEKVAAGFYTFSKEEDNWETINTEGAIEDVHKNILDKVLGVVKDVGGRPIEFFNFKSTTLQ